MAATKIIVVSQKGGVGKSTISVNLAAWFQVIQSRSTILLDYDPHGSSSTWLSDAKEIGVTTQHHPIDEAGGRRWLLTARTLLRRATESHDVVIADLTWTAHTDPEFLLGFDLVLVPSGVSEIELAATTGFVERNGWVFDQKNRQLNAVPTLVICPSRIKSEQVLDHAFGQARFNVPFMLAPPMFDDALIRDLFRKNFMIFLEGSVRDNFLKFADGIRRADEIHQQRKTLGGLVRPVQKPLSSYNSVLSKHLTQRAGPAAQPSVPGTNLRNDQAQSVGAAAAPRTNNQTSPGSPRAPVGKPQPPLSPALARFLSSIQSEK